MNIAMKSVLGINFSIALLLITGCEPPRYGVASFGYWSPHVLAECPSADARKTTKRRGEQYALVHFRSRPGKFTITNFMLVSPEGVEYSPSCFRNPPVRNWDQVIRFTRDGTINTVRGDLARLVFALCDRGTAIRRLEAETPWNQQQGGCELRNSAHS